jgi:hypothetical protein
MRPKSIVIANIMSVQAILRKQHHKFMQHTDICAMIKSPREKPTVSSELKFFVLSADILNHFVFKDIKFLSV